MHAGVTEALQKQTSAEYEKQCTADLMRIVDLVRGELTGLQRATLGESLWVLGHATLPLEEPGRAGRHQGS